MAERQLHGKNLILHRGNDDTSPGPESFDIVACITSLNINQSSTDLSTETNCGRLKKPGTKDASIAFDFVPTFSPADGKVAMFALQNDYTNQVSHNWKITTTGDEMGDPIFEFRGYISELPWKGTATDFFTGSGTIQVDEDGVTVTEA